MGVYTFHSRHRCSPEHCFSDGWLSWVPDPEDIALGDQVTTVQIAELSMAVISDAEIVFDQSCDSVVLKLDVLNSYTLEASLLCIFPLGRGQYRAEFRTNENGRLTRRCS